jgi:galactokinase
MALTQVAGIEIDRLDLARACQRAEHLATGVPSGAMDQVASLFGQPGQALLIDCRALSVVPIALPTSFAVLVVHSGIGRTLEGSDYADRRAACEAAARRIGAASLRDATLAEVADDPRARHAVTENQRVLDFVAALHAGAIDALGPLLLASHASLRDDYDVSTPELDLLVDLLVEHGALGARLTGAGFGGCVVALVSFERVADVAAKTTERYRAATGLQPSAFVVRAAPGAAELATGEGS